MNYAQFDILAQSQILGLTLYSKDLISIDVSHIFRDMCLQTKKFIQVNNYEIAVKFFRIHHNDIQQLFTNLSESTQFVQLMN